MRKPKQQSTVPHPLQTHWEDDSPVTAEEMKQPEKPVEHRFSRQEMFDAFMAGGDGPIDFDKFEVFMDELLRQRTRGR